MIPFRQHRPRRLEHQNHLPPRALRSTWLPRLLLILVATGFALFHSLGTQALAESSVKIWDTGVKFGQATTSAPDVADRTPWKPVPSNLMLLEADPAKAASDPGYYGREYAFQGDAAIENATTLVAFSSATARITVFSKADMGASGTPGTPGSLQRMADLAPAGESPLKPGAWHYDVIKNIADEAVVRVSSASPSSENDRQAEPSKAASLVLAIGRSGIVHVRSGGSLHALRVIGPLAFGIIPGFVGDDLIFDPEQYPAAQTLRAPSEHMLLGLVPGESAVLAMTWPDAKQTIALNLAGEGPARRIESVDVGNTELGLSLATLRSPGVWHCEPLKPTFLEKDIEISWKRPFAAKWITQFVEADVRTTFAFRERKAEIWRGVPGSYQYPVWFEGDAAKMHLSKKVPPKGKLLVYYREPQDTPAGIDSPVDILKAALGQAASEPILDVAGRRLRTHHRRGGDGVHRACTCGCTEAIQAVFEAGEEVAKRSYVEAALGDMVYFVSRHMQRIEEYKTFADELQKYLRAQGAATAAPPALKAYLESLAQIAARIDQEYDVQKENMKSLDHAAELTKQTMALTGKKDPNNLKAYMELLKAWRDMGGAQDYVVAQCHALTRSLCQEAGYGAADKPETAATTVAEEVRRRCRDVLRSPDGYEIWPDY